MSVRLSLWNNSALTGRSFMKFDIWVFSKICRENSSFIKTWQEQRVLHMKTHIRFWSYRAQFFIGREMFRMKVVEKIKTHILRPVTFFFLRKSCRLWDTVEKYCRAGEATDDNMVHEHCVLDTQGYKHTLRICNACFPYSYPALSAN
jgi:hypothetical protein